MLLQHTQRSGRDTGASLPDGVCSCLSSTRRSDSSADRLYVTASSSLSMSHASVGLMLRRHRLFSCIRRCVSTRFSSPLAYLDRNLLDHAYPRQRSDSTAHLHAGVVQRVGRLLLGHSCGTAETYISYIKCYSYIMCTVNDISDGTMCSPARLPFKVGSCKIYAHMCIFTCTCR
eukprot:1177289-Prorocentrum_minimum.AAC.2